ncbi:TPA: hypothetical protein ACGJPB_003982 [Escherichia coli]|uniref:general secretion pathway protein GspB n=1 Tax=Escherichia TaxID=561 RepID=UPI00044822C8|nr:MULTISPECIES: general secretion pathway protein GspB [unclassified Escherichia]EYD82238.1 protein pioO [Escherichia coli 1-176-05_S3_C2]WGM50796.1 general secretion pathway protein GspB [Escherichia ruysiae]HAL9679479.1 general secretion pathway protein GspB [Escherichia coli]MBB2297775.1 general secretion pathway protein GspB [Escherichia sp. 93.1462]HAV7815226.1 general secretion pathway protein GspB [Escherichia coli]
MFEFYFAAHQQRESGQRVTVQLQKHGKTKYAIWALVTSLWFAGMVLAGGYAQQLWAIWIVKTENSVEEAPPYKQSTQHYFFKKQPLPVVVEPAEDDADEDATIENEASSSEDEGTATGESEEKAGLRERVKNALNELQQ